MIDSLFVRASTIAATAAQPTRICLGTLERVNGPAVTVTSDKGTVSFVYRHQTTGHHLVALWDNSGIPNDSFVTRPARIEVKGLAIHEPVWVDLVSGRIYDFPADRVTQAGRSTIFNEVPLYDAPVLIAEKPVFAPPTGK